MRRHDDRFSEEESETYTLSLLSVCFYTHAGAEGLVCNQILTSYQPQRGHSRMIKLLS